MFDVVLNHLILKHIREYHSCYALYFVQSMVTVCCISIHRKRQHVSHTAVLTLCHDKVI